MPCERCGRPTFGRICGPCQKHGREGPLVRAKALAEQKGLEIVWSPANQAWLILIVGQVKLLAIKNEVEDVLSFVEGYP